MNLTEIEKNEIVQRVIAALRTSSVTISQLTPVASLDGTECFEISGGRKVPYSVIAESLAHISEDDKSALLNAIARRTLRGVSFDADETSATLTIDTAESIVECELPAVTLSKAGLMRADTYGNVVSISRSFGQIELEDISSSSLIASGPGQLLRVHSSSKTVGWLAVVKHTDGPVQQVFLTNLVPDANGSSFTGAHVDDGSMRIYKRFYNATSRTIDIVSARETVQPSRWSKWQEIAGDGVLADLSKAASDIATLKDTAFGHEQWITTISDRLALATPMRLTEQQLAELNDSHSAVPGQIYYTVEED